MYFVCLAVLDICDTSDINCNAPNWRRDTFRRNVIDMTKSKYKIAVIGGDARQLIVGSQLVRAGYEVALYGFGEDGRSKFTDVDSLCCSQPNVSVKEVIPGNFGTDVSDCGAFAVSASDAIYGSLGVVLPLPAAADSASVSMPLGGTPLKFSALSRMLEGSSVRFVCGGKLPDCFTALCIEKGIEVFDYYESEAFSIANAIPSAEGAIEIAMHELPTTLNGSSALVIGYGRIGKVLTRLLSHLGVSVTASARKPSDLAWIRADGYTVAQTGKLCELLKSASFDMIFNTVPHTVLGEEELYLIPKKTLVVDLASKPGGVDIPTADRLKLNVIWALSLPGKVAPVTSGKIIADAVLDEMRRRGICT